MLPRVFVPAMDDQATQVDLPADEAAHLARVLRCRAGDGVRAFNGRGLERQGVVAAIGRQTARLTLGGPTAAAPEPQVRFTLAQALLKGDKFDDVVRDAVMLGVARILPLVTEHVDVPRTVWRESSRLARWQRIGVASAKQCGRAVVPGIDAPAGLEEALRSDASDLRLMLGEPVIESGAACEAGDLAVALRRASAVLVAVGPEGGWSASEVARATAAGCRVVRLGPRTLRADAAPLVALAILLHAAGDL